MTLLAGDSESEHRHQLRRRPTHDEAWATTSDRLRFSPVSQGYHAV